MTDRWETWAKNNEVLPWLWKPQYGQTAKTTEPTEKNAKE